MHSPFCNHEEMPSSAAQARVVVLLICLVIGAILLYKRQQRQEPSARTPVRRVGITKTLPRLYHRPKDYIILPPAICGKRSVNDSVNFFVVVVSAVNQIEQRQAIRKTWGRDLKFRRNNSLVFLLGKPEDPEQQRRVFEESGEHFDIVQGDMWEGYRNLTDKSVQALHLATTHCPEASFLLKTDDDTFVNVPKLLKQVGKLPKDAIYGSIHANNSPIRDPSIKWFVTYEEYKPESYPDFVSGSAYIVGGEAIAPLYAQTGLVRPLWLEDVYVTGLCAEAAGLPRIDLPTFNSEDVSSVCDMRNMVTSHYMTPEKMLQFWHELRTADLKCN